MRRLLVANRGEIAVRIIRAARSLGIGTVAVYSDADAGAPHVAAADQAVRLGPTPAHESYLHIGRVIAAGREAGADAVHPGYGFLSENPEFADACVEAGFTFVGPTAQAMRALGDKQRAKQAADAANVPTVPSFAVDAVPPDAFPVLVKAAAGGGGRGMRIVRSESELGPAVEAAAREAAAGFGDATLLVERLVEGARHVEVQLLADHHGTCLYVGDRDCSLQRRHQKVVEEAPAFGLSFEQHRELGEAAVRIARVAGYENAGTAEFLLDRDGRLYFLELNARLQVEHPVTELAFGIDLVQWQLRIARGERLDLRQDDISPRGHAIEARLYAEDPASFLPTGGKILHVELPDGADVRVDHALAAGRDVTLAYDPLLAKVVATADSREAARRRLVAALRETVVLGAVTNAALLQHALELPEFAAGEHDIDTLEARRLPQSVLEPPPRLVTAARARARARARATDTHDPFEGLGPWRGRRASGSDRASVEAQLQAAVEHGDGIWFSAGGIAYEAPRDHVQLAGPQDAQGDAGLRAELVAPMPGTVIAVAEPGLRVATGDAVVVLEAMKMENSLAAPFDGIVGHVACGIGDLVGKGDVLAAVEREHEGDAAAEREPAGAPA